MAEEYILQLSSIYRSIVQFNREDKILLEKEISLAHSFLFLLNVRFGKGIELQTDILERHLHYYLPPLTLQLLLENAVKHNTITEVKPLTIVIRSDESNKLIIENNLQKKIVGGNSSMTGLYSIVERYRLLNYGEVIIEETALVFRVTLPLTEHI